jgi:hypothetical protein
MILFKKCALAFFFLFFLHGTSIGTRQQGISYNFLICMTLSHIYNQKWVSLYDRIDTIFKFKHTI